MRDPSCEMLFLLFSRRDVPYDLESVKRWDQICPISTISGLPQQPFIAAEHGLLELHFRP